MEVIWSDLASGSFLDILIYIQGFFGKRTADSISRKIVSFTDSLGFSPRIGKLMSNLSEYGEIRCAIYKQNRIYYQVLENKIRVIIIWDGRQDPYRLQSLLISFLTKTN